MRLTRYTFTLSLLVLSASLLTACGKGSLKVQLTSEPTGAEVYLREEKIGTTPVETVIEERYGDYNIYEFHAVKEDYLPDRQAFKEEFYYQSVADVIPEKIHFILQKREKHRVAVTSEPAGAEIVFNGAAQGVTPCVMYIKQSSRYPARFTVFAKKQGYAMSVAEIEEVASEEQKGAFEAPDTMHFELVKED